MFHTQDSTQRQLNYWMSKSEEQEDRLKAYKARMKVWFNQFLSI